MKTIYKTDTILKAKNYMIQDGFIVPIKEDGVEENTIWRDGYYERQSKNYKSPYIELFESLEFEKLGKNNGISADSFFQRDMIFDKEFKKKLSNLIQEVDDKNLLDWCNNYGLFGFLHERCSKYIFPLNEMERIEIKKKYGNKNNFNSLKKIFTLKNCTWEKDYGVTENPIGGKTYNKVKGKEMIMHPIFFQSVLTIPVKKFFELGPTINGEEFHLYYKENVNEIINSAFELFVYLKVLKKSFEYKKDDLNSLKNYTLAKYELLRINEKLSFSYSESFEPTVRFLNNHAILQFLILEDLREKRILICEGCGVIQEKKSKRNYCEKCKWKVLKRKQREAK